MVPPRAIGRDERRVRKILLAQINRYARRLFFLLAVLAAQPCSVLAETPEQLISAAKNEKELFFRRRSDDFRRQERTCGN